jgi:hypothetical protein
MWFKLCVSNRKTFPLKTKLLLHNIYIFISYFRGNTLFLYHKDQAVLLFREVIAVYCEYNNKQIQVGRQILAGGSLLRSGQTQDGEPKIGEHAQWHYIDSVTTQTLR